MTTYLLKPGRYIPFEEELNPNEHQIGTTYDDYMLGKWVILNDELIALHENNLQYSPKEIITLTPYVELAPTVELLINTKLSLIEKYDTSNEVNSFILNGQSVWLNKETRVGLMNSLNIEKIMGKEESTLWFDDQCLVLNIDAAILMLYALEIYALDCYNVTARHRATVKQLTTEEDILQYNYTGGYPDKLEFNV